MALVLLNLLLCVTMKMKVLEQEMTYAKGDVSFFGLFIFILHLVCNTSLSL